MSVKVVPNYIDNQQENKINSLDDAPSPSSVNERIINKELLLWSKLDVEEIFNPDYY